MTPAVDAEERQSRLAPYVYPALLFLLTLLFFAKPLARGQISAPLDTLGLMYPWNTEARQTFAPTGPQQNSLLEDQLTVMTPFHLFARQEVRQLRLPLWTPFEMGGAPFLANNQSAVLYPVNLVAFLLSPAAGLQFQRVIRPLGAGLGMYAFLLALGLARPAALFGAIAFMFSSFMILWLGWPLPAAATWLPWSFLAVERLLQSDGRREKWIATLAGVTALHLLAGHVETSFHILLALSMYVLVYLLMRVRTWRASRADLTADVRRLGAVIAGVILGVALGAIQILPTARYLLDSYTYEARAQGPSQPPQQIANVGSWLVPNISGNPAYAHLNIFPAQTTYDTGLNYNERTGYVGILTLVCAVMAFAYPHSRLRWQRSALAILLVSAVSIIYGIEPVYSIADRLPVLRTTNNYRLLLIACFVIAALGAIGFDGIIERLRPFSRWRDYQWRERSMIAGALCLLPAAAFALAGAAVSKVQIGRLMQWFARDWSPLGINLWTRSWVAFALILLMSGLTMLVMLATRRIEPRFGIATIVCLLVGDLFVFGAPYNPQVSPRFLYPPTPLTNAMLALGPEARFVIGQDRPGIAPPALIPNLTTPYRLRDLSAYDGIIAKRPYRFMDALNRHGFNANFPNRTLPNTKPDQHLLAVANVTHVLLPRSSASDGLVPVLHADRYTLFAVQGARPRVYLADGLVLVNDAASALGALNRLHVPGLDTVVETTDPLTSNGGRAAITRDVPGDVTIHVSAASPGLLVLSEGYGDGGWKATVDGRTTSVLHANYLYQAIVVPAGEHTVRFKYLPTAFVAGAVISGGSVVGLGALLVGARRRQTKLA